MSFKISHGMVFKYLTGSKSVFGLMASRLAFETLRHSQTKSASHTGASLKGKNKYIGQKGEIAQTGT